MNKLSKLIFSSIFAVGTIVQAHANESGDNNAMNSIVIQKASCDVAKASGDAQADCSSVNEQFEALMKSENVETILQMYHEKRVQMEFTFDAHSGDNHHK